MKKVIGNLEMSISNGREERIASEAIRDILQKTTDIKNVYSYDTVYGEMRLRGEQNGNSVSITWDYFSGNIILN